MVWNKAIIQILLRGNFFTGDAATLAASYNTATTLNDAVITKNGAEYSFAAIVDGILQAMGMIILAIGTNRTGEYRDWFNDLTGNIADGGVIPTFGSSSTKLRYGLISDVIDASDSKFCNQQPRNLVEIAKARHPRQKIEPYVAWTDDIVIYHSRTNVKARCVTWDRAAERTAMISSNTTAVCPLPEGLMPLLENLSFFWIRRDTFNAEQSASAWALCQPELNRIAATEIFKPELPAKV